MWCYQKLGYETLLLTELQRQQQHSHFCDTLLNAEGVSVPAHSCILSALSPHISAALSSMRTPPAGQSRLLEFQTLGASTLLHLVKLLYSGEMNGEGEKEKEEAISAAAKLGIHGLVEVTNRECKSRDRAMQHTEVGVQMEPPESEGRQDRWRREVRAGNTFLWKETLSDHGKDIWTQTEELQVNTNSPAYPAAPFETIDMGTLQNLANPLVVPSQIVPISLIYPPNENRIPQLSAAPVASVPESTEAVGTSFTVVPQPYTPAPPPRPHFLSQTNLHAADPQSCWDGRDIVGPDEWEGEQFKQFQGNIPEFISFFLNPDKEEGSCRGGAGRRPGAGVRGAKRAGTRGEKRPRRPRARAGERGRGGFTQMVQEVGVSKLQKLFRSRWGMKAPRTGQGGGAVGRKLCLKTRELLKSCQGRRGRSNAWEFNQGGDMLLRYKGGGSTPQCGRKNTAQQLNQDSLLTVRAQRSRAKTTSASVSSLPMHFCKAHALSVSSPSVQPSPSPSLLSFAASYRSPASSLLQTTSLPTLAPPPHENQFEHIDHFLEEMMMRLDTLPNCSSSAPHAQHLLQAGSSSGSCISAISDITPAQNKLQGHTTDLRGCNAVAVVAEEAGCSSSANGEPPVLQQHCEGELNEMLDNFLQSIEQHVESFGARQENEMGGSDPYTVLNTCQKTNDQTTTSCTPDLQKSTHARLSQTTELRSLKQYSQQSRSQPLTAVTLKHTEETRTSVKRQNKKRPKQYLFSLEKKRSRKPASRDSMADIVHATKEKPVVKLERRVLLPATVTQQGHTCQSLEAKSPAEAKSSSSLVKNSCDGFSKTYPIRSRVREPHIMDTLPILEEPLLDKGPPSAEQPISKRRGRPRKNGHLSLTDSERSAPPIQAQPIDLCDQQLEKNHERHEDESTVQPQEEVEGSLRRRTKRGAESEENTSDNATVTKRFCFEKTIQQTGETCRSEPADFTSEPASTDIEEVTDAETISLMSTVDCLQKEEDKPVWSELRLTEGSLMDEEMKNGTNKIIYVDGGHEDSAMLGNKEEEKAYCQSRSAPTVFVNLQPFVSPPQSARASMGSLEEYEDEDIDVIGASSPAPEPVLISWTESSEGEEEQEDGDIDVGEN